MNYSDNNDHLTTKPGKRRQVILNRSKVLFSVLLMLTSVYVNGQIQFTTSSLTYEQNFNAYTGNNDGSIGTGWTVTCPNFRGRGTGSSNSGGAWAFGSGSDYAAGYLGSGTSANITYIVSFVNNTGTTITALDISFDGEQWRVGGGNTQGFTVTGTGALSGSTLTDLNTSSCSCGSTGAATVTPKSLTLTGLTIAQGTAFGIQWRGTDGAGNDNGIAIDNFKITATLAAPACNVTAPGTVASSAGNSFCGSGSTTLSLNGTTPSTGITYQWKSSPDSITWTNEGTNATLAANPTDTTFYKCIVKCSTGNSADSTPGYKITVTPNPAATVSGGTNICSGQPATITFAGTPNAIVNYTAGSQNRSFVLDGTGAASIAPVFTSDTTYTIVSATLGSCSQNISSQQATVVVAPNPTATISGGTNICNGQSATITFAGTPNATVDYTAGSQNRSIVLDGTGAASIAPVFTSDTTYTIVSATLGSCSQNISSQQAAVVVAPNPTATISGGGTTICSGQSATITFAGTPNATVDYTAGSQNRSIVLDGTGTASIAPVFTSDTMYTIVSATLGSCSQNISGQQTTVQVAVLPDATISGGVSVCNGESATITFNGTPGATVVYTADGQNRSIVLDGTGFADVTYTFISDTTYSIASVTFGSCTHNISGQQVVITVTSLPVTTLNISGSTTICEQDSVVLTAHQTTGYVYHWKKDMADLQETGHIAAVKETGGYKVVITDANNCTDSSVVVPVTVLAIPEITITQADTSFCSGGVVTLYAVTPDTGVDFRWRNGNTDVTFATADFLEIDTTGTYSVIINRTHVPNCVDTSLQVLITVYPVIAPEITWDGVIFHTGIHFADYQWYSSNGLIPGATDSVYTPSANGGYYVSVTDSNGCSSLSRVYNVTDVGLGIAGGIHHTPIQVYPNPVSGVLYIKSGEEVNVVLIGVDGKVYTAQKQVRQLDVSQLADGVYFLRISDRNGVLIRNEKIVKRSL